jgi:hypothetical protein
VPRSGSACPLGGAEVAPKMREVHIDSGPPTRSYSTFAEAVSEAERHPAQRQATAVAQLLEGACVTGGSWSTGACLISFSNSRVLEVEAHNFDLEWRAKASTESQARSPYEPVKLVWNPELTSVFDPRSLLAQISGAEFTRLFVNEVGLLLYTRRNPILWFHAVRIRESTDDFLFASLEE